MSENDFASWVGRSVEATDRLTPNKVEAFRATLGPMLADVPGGTAPLAMHWCLATPTAPMDELGPDGHPEKGGFLPPIPLPRRMWAGGEIETIAPLPVDRPVTRRSTIADITLKEGRSGPLWFVQVEHAYRDADGTLLVRETQDIVYRDAAPAGAPAASGTSADRVPPPDGAWTLAATPALLFRYSALTFNTHRIHYDEPYARDEEGYRGLVVHGPLQASLLLNLAAVRLGAPPRRFRYRGVAPLIAGQDFSLSEVEGKGNMRAFTCRNASGRITMEASAS